MILLCSVGPRPNGPGAGFMTQATATGAPALGLGALNLGMQQPIMQQQPMWAGMQMQQQPIMQQQAPMWSGMTQQPIMQQQPLNLVGYQQEFGGMQFGGMGATIPSVLPQNFGAPAAAFGTLAQVTNKKHLISHHTS